MSTSLSPSAAAATTVGILAVRQKSYGTGSSPSIFHASLFLPLSLPSLSLDGGGRGVASPGAQTLPFPRTEHTLQEKTPVRVRLSRSISEKWIDMHTAWSLERGRADHQPTDRGHEEGRTEKRATDGRTRPQVWPQQTVTKHSLPARIKGHVSPETKHNSHGAAVTRRPRDFHGSWTRVLPPSSSSEVRRALHSLTRRALNRSSPPPP